MPTFKETDDFVVDLRSRQTIKSSFAKATEDRQEKSEKIPDTKYLPRRQAGQIPATGMWHFVQYNNAFLIILVVCVLAFGSLSFASENVRDATIGGQIVRAEGTDNTLLLEQDFDKFNMDFKITGIVEDEESYTVSYSYVDFDLVSSTPGDPISPAGEIGSLNGVWQYIERTGVRKIDKPFRQDLGIYLAEQLRQEAQARIKELKRLQTEEREKGLTKVVQVTEYSGLIGKVLDLGAAVFPGYEPVKKIELETPAVDEQIAQRAQSSTDNITNVYQNWVQEHPSEVAGLNGGATPATSSPGALATSTAESAGTSNEAVPVQENIAPQPKTEPSAPAENNNAATTPAETPTGQ